MSKALDDVSKERERQIGAEGWDWSHDDQHDDGALALAAACYAIHSVRGLTDPVIEMWPFDLEWWKPKDRRRDLVRAAALILAEMERLDRSTGAEGKS